MNKGKRTSEGGVDDLVTIAQDPAHPRHFEAKQAILAATEDLIRFAVFRVLTARRPAQDHEDVVQSSILAILEKLPSFRREATLTTFVYAIASNQARQFLNAEVRGGVVAGCPEEIQDLTGPTHLPSPDGAAVNRQLLILLRDRLYLALSPQERRCFTLILEDRSTGEIAVLLGLSPEHVRTVHCNIRRKARAVMERLDAGGAPAPVVEMLTFPSPDDPPPGRRRGWTPRSRP